jgi:hypothetical protein
VLFCSWYEEPDPDVPPFPALQEQIASQKAVGKPPFEVEFVGSESDLKSELGMAEKKFGFDDKIVIVTRYHSLRPIKKPMPSESPLAHDLHDLDEDPAMPHTPAALALVDKPPVKELKSESVTSYLARSRMWPRSGL